MTRPPAPENLAEHLTLPTGEHVLVRPIRPEDEAAHQEFFTHLDKHDVYFRFFGYVKGFSHEEMTRYTQIDYAHEMAFIAIGETGDLKGRTIGVVRAVGDTGSNEAEFAVVVRSDFKGHGLGYALLDKIIRYAKARGWSALRGQMLAENRAMLQLAHEFGFKSEGYPQSGIIDMRLDLA